jgi:hypothetical protein
MRPRQEIRPSAVPPGNVALGWLGQSGVLTPCVFALSRFTLGGRTWIAS